jgi:hypothetical protein
MGSMYTDIKLAAMHSDLQQAVYLLCSVGIAVTSGAVLHLSSSSAAITPLTSVCSELHGLRHAFSTGTRADRGLYCA